MQVRIRRNSGVPVKDQIRAQIEMAMLSGELPRGSRLPPIRTWARKLKVHANTISAAYRELGASGHVVVRSGSGVYVEPRPRRTALQPTVASKLREAVEEALATGLGKEDILAAVARFAEPQNPLGILVVDPSSEMGAVYASEIREALGAEVRVATLDELDLNPKLAAGLVVAVLPYHVGRVEGVAALGRLVVFTLRLPDPETMIPPGISSGVVLVVSESPLFLSFARVSLKSVLSTDFEIQTCLLENEKQWRRFLGASDVIIADAVSAPRLSAAGARTLTRLRLLSDDSMALLKDALRTAARV
ncbi:MAG: GntR family transcriptional regulator [Vicinamibacteria bacterium]|nr:GntR family transcriptional regulator [Vicinamibacteria bacterium]